MSVKVRKKKTIKNNKKVSKDKKIITLRLNNSRVKWGHLGHLDPNSTNTILSTNTMGSSGTL